MIFSKRYFLRIWRAGRKAGYPRCCVLHFSLIAGVAITRNKRSWLSFQAVRRGSVHRDNMIYVPCLWHKRLATPYPGRVARIDEDGKAHIYYDDEREIKACLKRP